MSGAFTDWRDPEASRPYPGQEVLACYASGPSPGGRMRYSYEVLRFEPPLRWLSSGRSTERGQPHRWAAIIGPEP